MTALSVTAERPGGKVRVMTVNDAAHLWLGELERQGKATRTRDTYYRLLSRLGDEHPHVDVDELTLTQLRRFLDRQAANRKNPRDRCSAATIAQQVSILSMFFRWLYDEGLIPADPAYRLKRPKLPRQDENDGIVSISTAEVLALLAACQDWREKVCLNVLAYTGARRRAVANLRLSDYDPTAVPPTITFREKGGKTITKPISSTLAQLLDQARKAGVWDGEDDPWLIPPRGTTGWARLDGYEARRDDRIVYRTVKEVAKRAGVNTHVHALRAAFAVFFLETKPEQVVALKDLMGHSRLETTMVYLRRMNRRRSMEAVLDLDFGAQRFEALREAEKEGFEPSSEALPMDAALSDIAEDLLDRARESASEGTKA